LFAYGMYQIDLLTFDAKLGEVQPFRQQMPNFELTGRGGTLYQPLFDYAEEHAIYDGMLILTDGEGPEPHWNRPSARHPHVLWALCSDDAYRRYHVVLRRTGRVCVIEND